MECMSKKYRALVGFSSLLLHFLQFFNPYFWCVILSYSTSWQGQVLKLTHSWFCQSTRSVGLRSSQLSHETQPCREGSFSTRFLNVLLALAKLIITSVRNGPTLQWASFKINIFIPIHAVSETSFFPNSHMTGKCLNKMRATTQSLA